MPLQFRAAAEADLERLLEIHSVAYPDARAADERTRNFTANPLGRLEDLVVAVRGDEIVAHAFLFPMETWFGGRLVPTGSIASVAVAPEARGQGIATALLTHLHAQSDARGDGFTMLYPYRQAFYRRRGYGPSTSRRRLLFDPAAVPRTWQQQGAVRIRRARAGEHEALRAAYERHARTASGWSRRTDAFWTRHFARERRQFLVASRGEGADVAGYVAFEIVQDEAHAAQTVYVDELVSAGDDAVRRALVGALGALRDQVAVIEMEVAADDPLDVGLVDADVRRFGTARVEHEIGGVVAGPMVRIEDPTRAFEARGYLGEGAFDVAVHADEGFPSSAEEMALSVRVTGGRAEVSAARAASSALRTTRGGLASMLYGGVRVTDAVRMVLAAADAKTAAHADAVLALPAVAPVDPF